MSLPSITITLNRSDAIAAVEALLWKYGSAIESEENYKKVYNTKSSSSANAVDASVLNTSWERRVNEITEVLEEFGAVITDSTSSKTFTVTTTNRWKGTGATLKSALSRYIEDGMMKDWLMATAPSEAEVYGNRLADDITNIKVELYKKGAP